jgi:hypothetical protein
LAVLSWRFVEQPFRKSTTPTHLLLKRYAVLAVAMMIPAFLFWTTNGLPQRNRAVQRLEMAAEPLGHDVCVAPYGVSHPMLGPPCVPPGQGRAVALIGDSHAAALASGLRAIAAQQGYRLVELTKSSCPALQGVVPYSIRHPGHQQQCGEFNRESMGYILRDPSIKVVVIAGLWFGYLTDGREMSSLLTEGSDPIVLPLARRDALLEHFS